jgi:hypothetical protein
MAAKMAALPGTSPLSIPSFVRGSFVDCYLPQSASRERV